MRTEYYGLIFYISLALFIYAMNKRQIKHELLLKFVSNLKQKSLIFKLFKK